MDRLLSLWDDHRLLTAAAGGIAVSTAFWGVCRLFRQHEKNIEYPKDTVILHQIGRGPYAPSLVPFAVKLETYLRMAKIPYENAHDMKRSSKGKFPFITYNGQNLADSAFSIDFLNKKKGVELNSWLTPEQRGIALAFQRLVEDDLYWILLVLRWCGTPDVDLLSKAFYGGLRGRLVVRYMIPPNVRKRVWAQGMGRHTDDEVLHILRKDLTALSDFLGNKPFLMGDRPCEQDCAVFGQLSQFYWQMPGPGSSIFKEFPRLVSYCERMKSSYWPDWNECTTQGWTVTATR